ncbi:hypothetical protein C5Y97_14535 [Blastopirellula marina]|uniref:Uncharacterized protein n=2 Tax=Blastopirellula marina TaxID=124 RepID=A0A2S8FSL3_9BACT|nr:hypothetical protein C5Y98_14525 [Blastopirellula marina]PTL43912.1 hypothetical protein C5Y97_14535 [Blastopirellula marina]
MAFLSVFARIRMHRWFYIAFLLLLAVAMQSPKAWTHRHEMLSPQELAIHLRLYHAGVPASETPHSWHVHRSAPQVGDLEFEQRVEEATSQSADLFCNRIAQRHESCDACPRTGDLPVTRHSDLGGRPPLYCVYQSLLI